jgi:hypothetical protein
MPRTRCSTHPDPLAAPPQTFAFGGTPSQAPGTPPPAAANNPPLQPFYAQPPQATPAPSNDPYTTPSGQSYRVVRTPSGLQIYQGRATPTAPPQATPAQPRATPQVAAERRPNENRVEPPAYVPTEPRRVIIDQQPRSVANERPRAAQPEQPRYEQPEPRHTTRNRQPIGRDGLTEEERALLNERRSKRTAEADRPRRSVDPDEREQPAPSTRPRVVVRRAEPVDSDLHIRSTRELDRMMDDDPNDHRLFKKPLFGH